MTEKKAHEVDGWLGRPDPRMAIVLIYGPDRGLVAERARLFVSKSGIATDDPFSLVRIDASEIERIRSTVCWHRAPAPSQIKSFSQNNFL